MRSGLDRLLARYLLCLCVFVGGGSTALPLNVDFNWASEYCRGVDVWPTRNRKDSPGQGRFVVFVFKNYCGGGV